MHSVPVQTFAQDAVLFYQQNREHTDSAVVRRQERMDKMKYTSAQANKLLKKLNDEYSALLDKEQRSRDFRAARSSTAGSQTSSTTAMQTTILPQWRPITTKLSTSFPARSLRLTRSTGAKPSILANDLFPSFPYECLTIL